MAGPPIVEGDTIEVSGRAQDTTTVIADEIRILNVEVDAECEQP